MAECSKEKVLIVDGSERDRTQLREILSEYELIPVESVDEAIGLLDLMEESWQNIDLVILDTTQSTPDALAVWELLFRKGWLETIPILFLTDDIGLAQIHYAYQIATVDVVLCPFTAMEVQLRVGNLLRTMKSRTRVRELEAMQQESEAEKAKREWLLRTQQAGQLLEWERIKQESYAAMTKEIHFEYTWEPSVLSLSQWGAKQLGLETVLLHPLENPKVIRILGGPEAIQQLQKLRTAVEAFGGDKPFHQGEYPFCINGRNRWYQLYVQGIWTKEKPSRCIGVLGKAVDIDELRKNRKQLEEKVSHDALTGLYNHASARELIQQRIDARPDGKYTMVVCDIDNFKQVNDTYGHLFGDRVIRHIADLLRKNTRSTDILARFGGDEFMVFLEGGKETRAVVQRLHRALEGELDHYRYSCSIGAAQTSVAGRNYETLFHAADQALYTGKQAGKGQYLFYRPDMCGVLETEVSDAAN